MPKTSNAISPASRSALAAQALGARLALVVTAIPWWQFCWPRLGLSLVTGFGLIVWQWQRAERHLAESARNLREAQRQRDLAEQSFKQAHEAVNDYCTRVSEEKLRDVPGTQRLRKELLEGALAYYQKFIEQRGDDPALRVDLGCTYFRIGAITDAIGSRSDALRAYERALTIYEELAPTHHHLRGFDLDLALIYLRVGMLRQSIGQPAAAWVSLRQAPRSAPEPLRTISR